MPVSASRITGLLVTLGKPADGPPRERSEAPPRSRLAHPSRVHVVILVRHAHAGNKSQWRHDDGLRPLTTRGFAQAASLVGSFAADDISVVWSSPTVRCRQTVEPLAADRGVIVQDHPLLAKEAPVDALLDWLLANPSAPWALCTHGEVFRALLHAARASGLVTGPVVATEKGAAWRVKPHEHGTTHLEYVPALYAPPATAPTMVALVAV
jgi:broad specificity phosphatase PhoE